MNMLKLDKAKTIMHSIGEIYDDFLVETETVDIAARAALRKKFIQCTAIGVAAASFGFALALCLVRPKILATDL